MAMGFSFPTIAISLLGLFILTKLFFPNRGPKKNRPPSPPSLPIFGHLHLLKKQALHHALAPISERCGPIVQLRFGSRPVLLVSSPSLAKECFTGTDVVFANRPRFPSIERLSYGFTTIGTASYGPHWRNVRRITTVEVLSSHRLNSFAGIRASEVRHLVRRLFQESEPDGCFTKVELRYRLFEFALNNLMEMIAGKTSVDAEDLAKFMESADKASRLSEASKIADFFPFLGWMDIDGGRKEAKRLADYRDEFLQRLIDGHRKSGEQEKTMIRDLLSMQKRDPENYTDQIIKGLVIGLLEAGIDTLSAALEWAMALLLNNPEKLAKAQIEIDQQIGHGQLTQESDLSNLPYLQCIVNETLRLYPVAPMLVPHESSEECVVGGYDVPRGTMLLVNAYSIQRDPKAWPEPAKFEPERFQCMTGREGSVMPFGMGRRRCPGEGLVNRAAGLVLGAMIQCFEWKRVGDGLIDMGEDAGIIMPKAIPLEAMYRPREVMKAVLSSL